MRTRHLLPLIAASVGLVLAGCGGDDTGSDATTQSTSGATATTASGPGASALAYSKCMREHGVDDFPDPQIGADGSVMMTAGGASANDPDLPEAQEACADLLQQGGPGANADPAREAEIQEQALAFAQCMRENGVPDFPDPQVNGGQVIMGGPGGGGGTGGDPNSPEFQAATQKCQASSGLGAGTQP